MTKTEYYCHIRKSCARFYLVISQLMSDIGQFCYYLEIVKNYSLSTIARYKSYLIRYKLRLLENNLLHTYDNIQYYKRDMLYYTSWNTVYKYITSIVVYHKYRAILYDDRTIKHERIENIVYVR